MSAPVVPAAVPRTARPGRPRSLLCPRCGAPITIRASGISVTAACAACGGVLDVADETVRLITQAKQRTRTPLIAIGTRGTLAGTEWEVIGFQVRSSEQGTWVWDEYLLFNPYQGFRFLAQDHGHWTLYALLRLAVTDTAIVPDDPHRYRQEFAGTARVEYVLGEFYWRVKAGDTVEVTDYVDAPYILSQERGGDEVTWSRGVYVDPAVIQAAFQLKQMPPRTGHPAHQPGAGRPPRMWLVACVGVAALIVLHSVSFGRDRNRTVFQQSFVAAARNPAVTSAAFTIPGTGGNLTVAVSPASETGWLQFDLALIDAAGSRREEQSFTIPPDIGDNGTITPSVTFASVPGGTYKLLVTASVSAPGDFSVFPATAAPPGPDEDVSVTVTRHTPAWSNFWLALLVLLAWPTAVSTMRWLRRLQNGPEG